MSGWKRRPGEERFDIRVLRTRVVFELEDGVTVTAEILGGEGVVRVFELEPDVLSFRDPYPIRVFGERRLRVEAEGRMETLTFDGLRPGFDWGPRNETAVTDPTPPPL